MAPISCSSSSGSAARRPGWSTRRSLRKFGTIGQETTGAGGFAKALRTVPLVLELAEATRARAARDAWIIDFTNPVGVVSQALLDRDYRAIGLCNVAITLQRMIARQLGVDPIGSPWSTWA